MEKLVTIVLPSYNGSKYIGKAIESVINQTYKNWELIIVNDCSTDNTLEIAKEYAKKDERIKVYSNKENIKLPASLNAGFSHAQGEYYTWTSDDNTYKPDAIKYMVDYLNNNKDIDMVSCDTDWVYEDRPKIFGAFALWFNKREQWNLAFRNVTSACFLYTKEIALKTGLYDESTFCAEDYDYWCRIALEGNIKYINKSLYTYLEHSQNLSSTRRETIEQKSMLIREKYAAKIIEKTGYSKKKTAKEAMDIYYDTRNKGYLRIAKQISLLYVYFYLLKRFIKKTSQQIFSVKNNDNKKIVRILGVKISFKRKKKYTKQERQQDKKTLKAFKNHKIRNKSVLVIEPNPYHGEIVPGFIKYFQDLNYNVDLFIRNEPAKENPLVGIENINIFQGTELIFNKMLKEEKIQNYDFVFFSSSVYWEMPWNFTSYVDYLGFEPKAKNGVMMIEHNIEPYLKEYGEEKYLEQKRLFTLSGLRNTPMLNPHYFKEIKQKNKNEKVNFIAVGAVEAYYKNHNLVFDAIDNLIKIGYKDFKITIVGSAKNFIIPTEYEQYIELKGRLPFDKMFEEIENADFILALLDVTMEWHERYTKGTTTGSRQLSLGFNKPIIISEKFAGAYEFNKTNSLLYKDNNLSTAMKEAIDMKNDKYLEIKNGLSELQKKVYTESLNNLRDAVSINSSS